MLLAKTEVDTPITGARRIKYYGSPPPLGLLYLAGKGYFTDPDNPNQKFFVEGEIINVYRRSNGYAYLQEPLNNFYSTGANIEQIKPTPSVFRDGSGVISVYCADKVTIENWEVPQGWDKNGHPAGIHLINCRNVTINNIRIGPSLKYGPGQGYGINLTNCYNITIDNVTVVGCRHALVCFGSRYGIIKNVRAVKCLGDGIDFDHGGGGYKLTYIGCDSGGTNGAVGNKYSRGSRDITILSHKGCKDLLLYGNTHGTVIRDSNFSGKLRCFANQSGRDMSATVEINQFAGGYLFENNPLPTLTLVGKNDAI